MYQGSSRFIPKCGYTPSRGSLALLKIVACPLCLPGSLCCSLDICSLCVLVKGFRNLKGEHHIEKLLTNFVLPDTNNRQGKPVRSTGLRHLQCGEKGRWGKRIYFNGRMDGRLNDRRAEIYTYESENIVYGLSWSVSTHFKYCIVLSSDHNLHSRKFKHLNLTSFSKE